MKAMRDLWETLVDEERKAKSDALQELQEAKKGMSFSAQEDELRKLKEENAKLQEKLEQSPTKGQMRKLETEHDNQVTSNKFKQQKLNEALSENKKLNIELDKARDQLKKQQV